MAGSASSQELLGWYFVGKPSDFGPDVLKGVFLPRTYMRQIRRFDPFDLKADGGNKMYVGSLFSHIVVVPVFDLTVKKGTPIPFFIERQKALDLNLI